MRMQCNIYSSFCSSSMLPTTLHVFFFGCRFNQLQPAFLRKIAARLNALVGQQQQQQPLQPLLSDVRWPAIGSNMVLDTTAVNSATLSNSNEANGAAVDARILWPVTDEYSNDVSIWNSLNLSGRREGPLYVDEPDYVLTQQEQHNGPARLFGMYSA